MAITVIAHWKKMQKQRYIQFLERNIRQSVPSVFLKRLELDALVVGVKKHWRVSIEIKPVFILNSTDICGAAIGARRAAQFFCRIARFYWLKKSFYLHATFALAIHSKTCREVLHSQPYCDDSVRICYAYRTLTNNVICYCQHHVLLKSFHWQLCLKLVSLIVTYYSFWPFSLHIVGYIETKLLKLEKIAAHSSMAYYIACQQVINKSRNYYHHCYYYHEYQFCWTTNGRELAE